MKASFNVLQFKVVPHLTFIFGDPTQVNLPSFKVFLSLVVDTLLIDT
jgi:hypothetical protein